MRFSTSVAAALLALTPSLTLAQWPASGSWSADGSWASSTDSVTTTYVASTTVTMTLLQVQTATMHYYSANSTIAKPTATSSIYVDVSATPSVCLNCQAATGAASSSTFNVGMAAVAGLAALGWASL